MTMGPDPAPTLATVLDSLGRHGPIRVIGDRLVRGLGADPVYPNGPLARWMRALGVLG